MKQILQSLKNGVTEIADVPVPSLTKGSLLIQTNTTLISAGTERMLLDFGKSNFLEKARQQPDKVRMVIDKIKTDGLRPTINTVLNKLDQPVPLGYSNVGIVSDIDPKVTQFQIGDRVISNGKHAEIVNVPQNLCAKIPDNVSNSEAAFTVVGAIALQGIRLVKPTLGECIVVTGLGLIGLITVQLLRANGCRVLGIDKDKSKLDLAQKFGAEVVDISLAQNPIDIANKFSRGRGVDAVLITAATSSNEPIHQAALMCRKRGRIVLVGVTGLKLSRDDFFQKELTFQVSASYGPGRYDPSFEEKGNDYPVGFVRWTEQRNFEAILDMISMNKLDVNPLISHRFDITNALNAYHIISSSKPSLGILLDYPGLIVSESSKTVNLSSHTNQKTISTGKNISFIGSGAYSNAVLIPAFKKAGACLVSVVSGSGVTGVHAGRKFKFKKTTTSTDTVFKDHNTDAVVITTRHDTHAKFILKGLQHKKHVFVEKPLCMSLTELNQIDDISKLSNNILMVGFNRRFAPQIQKMKELVSRFSYPKSMIMTVNAGAIPINHWTQDPDIGGGRIIGECCHFIDLLRFMNGTPIIHYQKSSMKSPSSDTVSIQLTFKDGLIGSIHYFSNGTKSYPKERLEIFADGSVLQLDNFRRLQGFNWPGFKKMNLSRQDKGQEACVAAFLEAIQKDQGSPIPINEIIEVSRISIELA